ncbi:hypothetical protein [Microbacterium hibisci]|uniref:hypothetical protein n=1 Tax=Microbacterium hibisci TaxID=2036000 RepID=UPI001942CBD6|nr:hypothetical protein [Microbacterium hibisci]
MAAVTTPAPHTASVAATAYPRDGRLIGRVSSRLAGGAALTAGILSIVIGTLQFLFPQDEDPAIDPRTRLILVMFTVSLWAFAVLFLGLARYARSTWGAVVAGTGTVLLTLGTITSAANGIDLDFFPVVAMAANALWLVGVIGLTVSLVRARQMSLWLVLPLPIVQVFLLFFSQTGGGVPAGLFVSALGVVLLAGGAQSRARRRAAR